MTAPRLPSYVMNDSEAGWLDWHDARIHGVLVLPQQRELLLDLDCVVSSFLDDNKGLSCWVVPVTAVFRDVTRMRADLLLPVDSELQALEQGIDDEGLASDDGGLTKPGSPCWTITGPTGFVRFLSSGFTLYFRSPPVLAASDGIPEPVRGPVSFERRGYEPSGER
jgi:hypothetical protein